MTRRSLRAFARENWLPLLILSASALTALWFAGTMLAKVIYFNDPRHQDQALKPWMTPRYVVMSYDLPRPVVAGMLVLPETGKDRHRMDAIADEMGMTLEELTAHIRAGAASYRAAQQ